MKNFPWINDDLIVTELGIAHWLSMWKIEILPLIHNERNIIYTWLFRNIVR